MIPVAVSICCAWCVDIETFWTMVWVVLVICAAVAGSAYMFMDAAMRDKINYRLKKLFVR